MHVMTRIEGRKDDDMLLQKGGQGFPYIVLMNAKGEVVHKFKGPRTVKSFADDYTYFLRYTKAKAGALAGDAAAKVELAIVECLLGKKDYEQMVQEIEALKPLAKPDEGQQKEIEQLKTNEEAAAIFTRLQAGHFSKEAIQASGPKLRGMLNKGRIPTTGVEVFWQVLAVYAKNSNDGATLAKILPTLRKMLAKNQDPRAKKWLDEMEAKLKELQADPPK